MTPNGRKRTDLPAWRALHAHSKVVSTLALRQLFRDDPTRAQRMNTTAAGIYLDYSKNRITHDTIALLIDLAIACELPDRLVSLFQGNAVNTTENRPALHTALRSPTGRCVQVGGVDVVGPIHAMLDRMFTFAQAIRSRQWQGATGKPIRNIVNIGIGGSDLGPVLASEALSHYGQPNIRLRFVSSIDGADFVQATSGLDAGETLFIICSKTFSTIETIANALAARRWVAEKLGTECAVDKHFVAVTSNIEAAALFGIPPGNTFGMWDWVGGRYSLCSAIGLSLAISIGPANFQALLEGFHAMDTHFRTTPFERNLPALMGLLAVWNTNFLGMESLAVLPYDHALRRLPAYIQQLSMESNGKHVSSSGASIDYATAPIVWGEPGTNGQHSFFQLLHQGTPRVACDFIGFAQSWSPLGPGDSHHDVLIANMLAQSELLAFGRNADEVRADPGATELVAHRVCPGNRPSNTLLAKRISPESLGALIALYEHSVFTQGVIWDIDSFDQWGVETGKAMSQEITRELTGKGSAAAGRDGSTSLLMEKYRQLRAR